VKPDPEVLDVCGVRFVRGQLVIIDAELGGIALSRVGEIGQVGNGMDDVAASLVVLDPEIEIPVLEDRIQMPLRLECAGGRPDPPARDNSARRPV
jgi:hypothetical protein